MKMIPWRKQEEPLAFENDLEQFWKGFLDPFDGWRNRLPAFFQTRTFPVMNFGESENHFHVSLELPGMDVKDVNIELMGNQLTISGERKWEEEKKSKELYRVESQYGSFSRSVNLPENARMDREAIEATFQKGILEIKVPKLEPTPAARIQIKSK